LKGVCPQYYVGAPDISMAEHEMEVFAKSNGDMRACTGKPAALGGIPHELGSTGFGVFHAIKVALKHMGKDVKGASFAVEGFGNVGEFVCKFMTEAGAKLVAVSDSKGALVVPEGIDFKKLFDVKKEKGTVTAYGGKVLPTKELIYQNVDVLVTAAIPDLFDMQDVPKIKAKLIVEGSNIPTSTECEQALAKQGVIVVPDFIANAGGVISSYVEYIKGTPNDMWKLVEEKISKNTQIVLERAKKDNVIPREAGLKLAKERVRAKCKTCK